MHARQPSIVSQVLIISKSYTLLRNLAKIPYICDTYCEKVMQQRWLLSVRFAECEVHDAR